MSGASRLRALLAAPVPRILMGSIVGQGAVVGVSPLLTRIYSPADFGAFALITAICAVLGGLVTLSWERAIVIPPDDETARALLLLGAISVCGGVVATGAVTFLLRDEIAAAFGAAVFADYWSLVPVTLLLIGGYALISAWLVRIQDYPSLARRNAWQGLTQALSSVALGLAGLVPVGLLSSLAVGRAAGLLGMRPHARRLRIDGRWSGASGTLGAVLRRYRRFPLVNTWSRLLNSLGLQLPTILILVFYGVVEAGLYALTVRVLAAPVGIVVDALSQFFEGTFARQVRERGTDLRETVLRFARRQAVVGFAPTLLVLVGGRWLYQAVFGDRWEQAGLYAQLIVVAYYAQFVVTPVSRALVILKWQGTQLAWDLGRAVGTAGAVTLCAAAGWSMSGCMMALTVAHVLAYVLLLLLCARAASTRELAVGDGRPTGLRKAT